MTQATLSLHHTTEELTRLYEIISEAEGELTPEIEAQLNALQWNRKIKAEAIVRVMRERSRVAEAQKAEATEIAAMAKRNQAQADSLKSYLLREMQNLGEQKITGDTFTICRQKSGGMPHIECPGEIPQDLRRVVPERIEFDAKAAYQKIKALIPSEPGTHEIDGLIVEVRERLAVK